MNEREAVAMTIAAGVMADQIRNVADDLDAPLARFVRRDANRAETTDYHAAKRAHRSERAKVMRRAKKQRKSVQ